MTFGRLLLTPEDAQAPARLERLRALGLGERPEPALDAVAQRLADRLDVPYAAVNFVTPVHQFLAGRHPCAQPSTVRRTLPRDHGYCPYVVVRRKALVLEDVRQFPRFATNPVVYQWGVLAYLGAPLMDGDGLALGTVCAATREPRAWGGEGLDVVKTLAAELGEELTREVPRAPAASTGAGGRSAHAGA
ncbi:GAF domain-containing protein [Streptomyces sp. NPDC049954]|uniref:GAF domain-containing protein n=1 Tax=Streptomyces sp. NPDC049954 TaxID=3155779 RepID=UPI00342EDBF1